MTLALGTMQRLEHAIGASAAAEVKAILEATSALSDVESGYLDGAVPGTPAASKTLVMGTGNELGTVASATITALIASAFTFPTVARTATADGLTTGIIAAAGLLQFVTVTSAGANNIIALPTPTPGTIVILVNGGTGYELRSSAPASVAINGGLEAAAESAIAASTLVVAVCKTATAWAAWSIAGTTLAAVEAAAA